MKNVFAGITTLALASLLAFKNRETLETIDYSNVSAMVSSTELLVITFLGLISLFLLFNTSAVAKDASSKIKQAKRDAEGAGASKADVSNAAVIYFLSLLQEKGRLLDFVMDDVTPYSDEQVGQVARVVHKGVQEALRGTIEIEALHDGKEGDAISVDEQYNAQTYRFVGNVKEKPPISGVVLHRGWKAKSISLPSSHPETNVVHPVEIEVS